MHRDTGAPDDRSSTQDFGVFDDHPTGIREPEQTFIDGLPQIGEADRQIVVPYCAVLPLFPGRALRSGVADGLKTSSRGQPIRRLEVEGDQESSGGPKAPRRRSAV